MNIWLRSIFVLGIISGTLTAYAAQHSTVVRLSIRDVFKIAQERHADILMADERVQQALARAGQATAGLLPHVSGVLSGARQTRDLRGQGISLPGDPHIGPFNSFDARMRMTQALLDPSAISRLEQATQGKQLSIAESRKVRNDVLALAAMLFINARQSNEDFKAQRADLAFVYQNYRTAKTSFEQGIISASDWEQAEVNLARSYAQYRQVKSQAIRDRLELCAALDLPLDATIEYLSDGIGVNVEQSPEKNLARHPDVQVAQGLVTLNIAGRKVERSQQLPQISAMADYGRAGEGLDESSNTYAIGLQVSVPFWEGGLRKSKIKEAESQLKESRLELERTKRSNHARLLESVETMQQAKAFQVQAQLQSKSQQRQLKIAVQRYKNGSGSLLDVYERWAEKSASIAQEKDALAAYQLAQINVAHAMGLLEEIANHPDNRSPL